MHPPAIPEETGIMLKRQEKNESTPMPRLVATKRPIARYRMVMVLARSWMRVASWVICVMMRFLFSS